jgi:hypothetical protein
VNGVARQLRGRFGERLPPWLAPREPETPASRRLLWPFETTALILVGLLLSAAAINDLVLTVHSNGRTVADMATWRRYTHHDYLQISVRPVGLGQTRDVACGNASPGPSGKRTQICLVMVGPVVHGLRSVSGGWKLPPRTADHLADRYACFGSTVAEGLCRK